jgi:hypothetical protein
VAHAAHPPEIRAAQGVALQELLEPTVLTDDWRIDYNVNRPHSAHGDLTPSELAQLYGHTIVVDPGKNEMGIRVPRRSEEKAKTCTGNSLLHTFSHDNNCLLKL